MMFRTQQGSPYISLAYHPLHQVRYCYCDSLDETGKKCCRKDQITLSDTFSLFLLFIKLETPAFFNYHLKNLICILKF